MTVQQLIERLKDCDKDLEITCCVKRSQHDMEYFSIVSAWSVIRTGEVLVTLAPAHMKKAVF